MYQSIKWDIVLRLLSYFRNMKVRLIQGISELRENKSRDNVERNHKGIYIHKAFMKVSTLNQKNLTELAI